MKYILPLLTLFYIIGCNSQAGSFNLYVDDPVFGEGKRDTITRYFNGKILHAIPVIRFSDTTLNDGLSVEYEKNNAIYSTNYKLGKRDGIYSVTVNGEERIKAEFKMNRLWNIFTYKSTEGKTLDYGYLKNGKGHIIVFYKDGTPAFEGDVDNGYEIGKWGTHSNAGVMYFESIYSEGEERIIYLP